MKLLVSLKSLLISSSYKTTSIFTKLVFLTLLLVLVVFILRSGVEKDQNELLESRFPTGKIESTR